ncbi:unnamed protein product, partial [Sphacelaria rigidula]
VRNEITLRGKQEYAKSMDQEKVRNYFLKTNGAWQNATLTKQVEDDAVQVKQNKEDSYAELLRDADELRQAAANAYLAEYDDGEAVTQATLRI